MAAQAATISFTQANTSKHGAVGTGSGPYGSFSPTTAYLNNTAFGYGHGVRVHKILYFDLSSIINSHTPGYQFVVTGASFSMSEGEGTHYTGSSVINPILANWVSGSVSPTYNNIEGNLASAVQAGGRINTSTYAYPTSGSANASFNKMIEDWLNQVKPNYGFAVRANDSVQSSYDGFSTWTFSFTYNQVAIPVTLGVNKTDFGNVRVGTSKTADITVTNTGGGTLTGTIGPAINDSYVTPNMDNTAFSLTSGGISSRTFTYTPENRGTTVAATVDITSNAGNSSQTLTGSAVGPEVYTSAIQGSTLDFGILQPGDSASQTLDISNITTDIALSDLTDLTILSLQITGENASLFSYSGFTPGMVIHKGGSLPLLLQFINNIGMSGMANATLIITTDEDAPLGTAGNVYTFQLQAIVVPEINIIYFFTIAFFFFFKKFRKL